MTYKDMNDYIIEKLKDPEEAEAYLNAALEDYFEESDAEAFFISLKKIIKARQPISQFANEANLNRQHLYNIFNCEGNPQFNTIGTILKNLGFKLEVKQTCT